MKNRVLIIEVWVLLVLLIGICWFGYVNTKHIQTELVNTQKELKTNEVKFGELYAEYNSLELSLKEIDAKYDSLVKRSDSLRDKNETLKIKNEKLVKRVSTASRSGTSYKSISVNATAYTHTGNATASGVMPKVGMIAVDPRVIPMGSMVRIEGMGTFKATDTGGLIKGNKIDIFMDTRGECIDFGIKKLSLQILK